MDKESVVLGCGCEVYGDETEELKQRFRLLRLLIASTALSMPLLWDLPPHFQFVLATLLQFGPGLYFIRNAILGLKNRSLGTIETLNKKLTGHYRYYGIYGNWISLKKFYRYVKWELYKTKRRRDQSCWLTWQKFKEILRIYPLEWPRVYLKSAY